MIEHLILVTFRSPKMSICTRYYTENSESYYVFSIRDVDASHLLVVIRSSCHCRSSVCVCCRDSFESCLINPNQAVFRGCYWIDRLHRGLTLARCYRGCYLLSTYVRKWMTHALTCFLGGT